MQNENRKLELAAMKISELAQAVHVMWLGLQGFDLDMEHALSCMSLLERELWEHHEKLLQIIEQMESR